jgi:transcriptional regulator with XRE-family HTH domain
MACDTSICISVIFGLMQHTASGGRFLLMRPRIVAKCGKMMPMETVRALRSDRGWSQMTLAQRAGVSLPTVQRAEAGTRNITYSTALKLARAFEVDVSDLMPESDIPGVFTATPPEWASTQSESIAALHAKLDRLLEICDYSPHIDTVQN